MIDQIKDTLQALQIDQWKIIEIYRSGEEVYFIGKKLDMSRRKDVRLYEVTVYSDFVEGEECYLGESRTRVDASMDENEISKVLGDAKKAATYVKNKVFELPVPSEDDTAGKEEQSISSFGTAPLASFIPKIVGAIYDQDDIVDIQINSCEVFLTKVEKSVLSSTGIDRKYTVYENMIEIITDYTGEGESVELFIIHKYGDLDEAKIKSDVKEMLNYTKLRAMASPMIHIKNIPVILKGEAVEQFMSYYVNRSSAQLKYEGLSDYEVGKSVQGEKIEGDYISVTMLPVLKGSSLSSVYDDDGIFLEKKELIKRGKLLSRKSSAKYAHYLGDKPTGKLKNYSVALGDTKMSEVKEKPYFEILSFSDFNMDDMSGDLGGEIRLARYFDGVETVQLTGGSISSNIEEVQNNIKLSCEAMQVNHYFGPNFIVLNGLDVASS